MASPKIKNINTFISGIASIIIGITWFILNFFLAYSDELGVGGYVIPALIVIIGIYSLIHAFFYKTKEEIKKEIVEEIYEYNIGGAFEDESLSEERAELYDIMNTISETDFDTDTVIARIDTLLTKCQNPKDFSAVLYTKALCYEESDEEKAILTYKEILEHNPNSPEILFYIATALTQHKKYEDAIPYYEKAIELAPNEEFYNYSLARELTRLGNHEKAKLFALREIEIQKNFYGAYSILAINSLALGDAEAEEEYKKTAKSKGQDMEALSCLFDAVKSGEEIPFEEFSF